MTFEILPGYTILGLVRMKSSTRHRLLTAAQAVFLKHGFEYATVQMIASEADANIAAISYHYGSKADLYAECVRAYLEDSVSRMPVLGDNPHAPREQLTAFIRWFFTRYRSDSLLRHLSRDMVHIKPTLLPKIVETVVRPEFDNCTQLISSILPANVPSATVRAWVMNVMALCVAPIHGMQLHEHLYPEVSFDDEEIEHQAEQAIRLVLAGLDAEVTRPRQP